MRQLLVNQQWYVKGGDAERKSQKRHMCWDMADGSHHSGGETRDTGWMPRQGKASFHIGTEDT